MKIICYVSSLFLTITLAGLAFAADDSTQVLADNYSTCLKAAVIAERKQEAPSVERVKATCAAAIAAFHQALPEFAKATVYEQLDKKLLQELQQ